MGVGKAGIEQEGLEGQGKHRESQALRPGEGSERHFSDPSTLDFGMGFWALRNDRPVVGARGQL